MRYLFLFSFIINSNDLYNYYFRMFYLSWEMSVAFTLGSGGVYFILLFISDLITYYNYKKAVVAPIHGGKMMENKILFTKM